MTKFLSVSTCIGLYEYRLVRSNFSVPGGIPYRIVRIGTEIGRGSRTSLRHLRVYFDASLFLVLFIIRLFVSSLSFDLSSFFVCFLKVSGM